MMELKMKLMGSRQDMRLELMGIGIMQMKMVILRTWEEVKSRQLNLLAMMAAVVAVVNRDLTATLVKKPQKP